MFLMERKMKYDKREIFQLSDGGSLAVDYLGYLFNMQDQKLIQKNKKPLLFVLPGFGQTSQSMYMRKIAKTGRAKGY
jgi:predicted alpha/beta-fold hydrolase